MDEVCRLCLRTQDCMISIFSENDEARKLRSQIMDCCCIQILETDKLPKLICTGCIAKVSSVYEFRKLCKESDQTLRKYYKEAYHECHHAVIHKECQDICVQTDLLESSKLTESFLQQEETPPFENTLEQDSNCSEIETNQQSECVLDAIEHSDIEGQLKESENNTTEIVDKSPKSKCRKIRPLKERTRCSDRLKKKEILICHTCNKTYTSKQALLKHTKSHVIEDSRQTLSLNKKKKTKRGKKQANGKNLNAEKQYLCDICSRTFVSKSGLLFHLRNHNRPKLHNCKYCNKSFPIQSYKDRHERTHTGIKHFVCHICSAAFASSNGLMYHLRRHTGETKFECETCGKSFTRLKYLKEHTFTHTGERPFICKLCGSSYGSSGSLYVHVKKCKVKYANEGITHVKEEMITDDVEISS